MRLRSWRGFTPLTVPTRGRFPWARFLLIGGTLAIAAYLLLPRYLYVSADGLVRGDLVPVATLYSARIDRLYVQCDQRVRAGQKLAVVSNFIVQANYEHQYEDSLSRLSLATIALEQGVNAARTAEAVAGAKYEEANIQARRLHGIFHGYDQAYHEGAIGRVEWDAKREDAQAAAASATAAAALWKHAREHVQRIDTDQQTKIALAHSAADRVAALSRRSASETIVAPVSGYIVDCRDRPANVIAPGVPIFKIFEPDRAYVIAFFDPHSMVDVQAGRPADLSIPGLPSEVHGRVATIDPELAKLPEQLTRFFWQHVQWSQYRPVRVALDRAPLNLRNALAYNAQVRVRIRVREGWPNLDFFRAATHR
ncbi:MAG: HlyD family secretion protein [Candidatus Velthaea sp.]